MGEETEDYVEIETDSGPGYFEPRLIAGASPKKYSEDGCYVWIKDPTNGRTTMIPSPWSSTKVVETLGRVVR